MSRVWPHQSIGCNYTKLKDIAIPKRGIVVLIPLPKMCMIILAKIIVRLTSVPLDYRFVSTVTNANSGHLESIGGLDCLKTRILSYRTKGVQEVCKLYT
jgi:hypothetical protein